MAKAFELGCGGPIPAGGAGIGVVGPFFRNDNGDDDEEGPCDEPCDGDGEDESEGELGISDDEEAAAAASAASATAKPAKAKAAKPAKGKGAKAAKPTAKPTPKPGAKGKGKATAKPLSLAQLLAVAFTSAQRNLRRVVHSLW